MSVASRLAEANRLLQLNQINPQILSQVSAQLSAALEELNQTGTGDVVGPASAVSGHSVVFSGTSGKLLADGGAVLAFGAAAGTMAEGDDARFSGLYIPDPAVAINADFSAADLVDPITETAPTATRKFDPRDATTSMAFTILKTNTAAFGWVIDVTTGGNQGWTTPDGLNTDYTLFGSADAAAGSWLIRIDLPNKIVLCTPVA